MVEGETAAAKPAKKSKRVVIAAVLIVLLLVFVILFFYSLSSGTLPVQEIQKTETGFTPTNTSAAPVALPQSPNSDSRFGFVNAGQDFIGIAKFGIGWDRPFPGPFNWQDIQDGNYGATDTYVKEAQKHDFAIVAIIWPYWDQDQALCHAEELPAIQFGKYFGELADKRGTPCGHDKYAKFIANLVERYDGDGKDDMPGLRYGVKYWEVASEPNTQNRPSGIVYFQGKPKDYVAMLKETASAIKAADPEAKVLNGGAATASAGSLSFWDSFFGFGGGRYIDIFSMHCLDCDESLGVQPYQTMLASNNLQIPIWVTDVSYFGSDDEQAKNLYRGYITGFGSGVEKIFYDKWQIRAGGREELAALKTSSQDRIALNTTAALIKKLGGFKKAKDLGNGEYEFYFAEGHERFALLKPLELQPVLQGNLKMTAYDGIDTIRYNIRNVDSATVPVIIEAV